MKAALYARYSTDRQSEASIEDQHRVCERIAERHGFTVVARFSDAAISGGTTLRPGYQRLLSAARRHEFDAVIAEDTSRLWRNLAEQSPRLAELCDLGVAVVTHDLDTRHESAEIMGAVGGAMAAAYRKEIGRRTRRGLEGRARAGESAGGRAYGFIPPALSSTHRMQIDEAQAKIVRQIFEWYVAGWSPRAIAMELNRRGVASPGSSWKRTERRTSGWMPSAVAGDPLRGTGILNNETYRGRVVWNRVRWVRSAADSSKRRCVPNPPTEWVVREDESLRIIPQALWNRVKARQARRGATVGARVKIGVTRDRAERRGREPKFPFSGLLRCADCGAAFVMAGKDHYCCSSRAYGGPAACANDAYLRKSVIEPGLVTGIKRELLNPAVLTELERRVRARLKLNGARQDRTAIPKLEREVAALVEAIGSGALRSSPALAQRLQEAEAQLERLKAEPASPEQLLPELAARCRTAIERLDVTLAKEPMRARMELAEHVGEIRVRTTPEEIILAAQKGQAESMLIAATGTEGARQIKMVAGAGFEPATFGL
jgi:site-specific DNA recombinase